MVAKATIGEITLAELIAKVLIVHSDNKFHITKQTPSNKIFIEVMGVDGKLKDSFELSVKQTSGEFL